MENKNSLQDNYIRYVYLTTTFNLYFEKNKGNSFIKKKKKEKKKLTAEAIPTQFH